MKPDIGKLADETSKALSALEDVDGVIVLVARASDDTMSVSMSARDVSVDSMIAAIVQALGKMRAAALANVTEKMKKVSVTIN